LSFNILIYETTSRYSRYILVFLIEGEGKLKLNRAAVPLRFCLAGKECSSCHLAGTKDVVGIGALRTTTYAHE
ncbi:MAG TPA: hypothetical protein VKV37_07765, partial [Ktedonobacteraceae bacterium]|nr:hypothetical protein [Ktedonobacteraceae bacterium]